MEGYPYYQGNPASNQYNRAMDYFVDMVLCIDATGSMEDFTGNQTKIINMVKQNALNLYGDLQQRMELKSKKVQQLRVRIIAFRDYAYDQEDAMLVTDFFYLPQQSADFEACVHSITASGGGDVPEDGLEALAYAIRSDWHEEPGSKSRQVIVVWTDAPTHPLGYGKKSAYYPNGMPQDLSELTGWWDDMNQNYKRLLMFAPNEPDWSYISDNWDNVVHIPSVAGNGMAETTYDAILNAIVNSI